MHIAKLKIDNVDADPACARFIFQQEPFPGGHEYSLAIRADSIDAEWLSYAKFETDCAPSQKRTRDWMYWLGAIISDYYNSEDCKEKTWVINNIASLQRTEAEILIRGECSPWVHQL